MLLLKNNNIINAVNNKNNINNNNNVNNDNDIHIKIILIITQLSLVMVLLHLQTIR